jgi:hypothetical protein
MATISTNGYNHSGCTDISGRYFYYLEEIPEGRPGRIVDLQNLATGDIELVGQFFDPLLAPASTNAIYHNPFRKGNLLFLGAYQDGLIVYDITKPTEPKLVAWYDTYPNATYSGYTGVWSVYPWLPSGNVIVGDMETGLYMVKLDASITNTTSVDTAPSLTISPNPVHDLLQVNLPESFDDLTEVLIFNSLGQVIQQGQLQNKTLKVSAHPAGLYYFQLRNEKGQVAQAPFVKL